MFYSALSRNQSRKHCIGAAVATVVSGPYEPVEEPLVCDFKHGGVIDPAYFQDPLTNTSYLVYKQDGNAIGVGGACMNGDWPNTPTPLLAIELDAETLLNPVGEPFELLSNIQSDGANIESPLLWYYDYHTSQGSIRSYHLSYNSGCYAHMDYRIQHVNCVPAPPTGIRDCQWSSVREHEQFSDTLIATGDTQAKLMAPGGPAMSVSNQGGVGNGNFGKQFMAFHADINSNWFKDPVHVNRTRGMFIARLGYWGQESMLKLVGLVEPGSHAEDLV
jgi:hypothetical protein